jgi:hypothetical protein
MTWEDIYLSAVREVDPQKMPERIAAARQAIQERLPAAQNGDPAERERMEHALSALAVLETESKSWSSR